MRIERMTLDAGSFSHHAEGRRRRAELRMQFNCRLDDVLTRFRLLYCENKPTSSPPTFGEFYGDQDRRNR
jgi:hypothetical protein